MEDAPRYRTVTATPRNRFWPSSDSTPPKAGRTSSIRNAPLPTSSSASSGQDRQRLRIPARRPATVFLAPTLPHPDFTPLFDKGRATPGCISSWPATGTASPSTCLRLTAISPTRGPSGSRIYCGISSPRRASARRGRPHRWGQRREKPPPGADPASRQLPRRQGGDGHPRVLMNFTDLGEGPMAEALMQNQASSVFTR